MLKEDLVRIFENALKLNWDKPCFSDYGSDPLTFAEVAYKIKEMHAVFEVLGIKKGDKISLCGKNSTGWAIVYLSAVTCGAVIVPLRRSTGAEQNSNLNRNSCSPQKTSLKSSTLSFLILSRLFSNLRICRLYIQKRKI